MNYYRIGLSFFGVTSLLAMNNAPAALMPDGSDDAAYRAYGDTFAGDLLALTVTFDYPGLTSSTASAVRLNSRYALTAAHFVFGLEMYNPSFFVATGDNYKTNPGTVLAISDILVYPGYAGTTTTTPDLAILTFSEFLLPDDAPLTIGFANAGEIVIEAGFGASGTPSTGFLSPRDGFRRAWNARIRNNNLVGYSPTYFQTTTFGGLDSGISLNGRGAAGDSGGPVFNASGELIGVTKAASNGNAASGVTIFQKLSEPDVLSWIQQNTVVPEPSSALLLLVGTAYFYIRRSSIHNDLNG